MKWRITNTTTGVILGVYDGETESDALNTMARDAGYRDHAQACETVGCAELTCEPVITRKEFEKRAYSSTGDVSANGPRCSHCGDLAAWGTHPLCDGRIWIAEHNEPVVVVDVDGD